MPTIAGIRRRGFTPEAIREFCDRIGVAKRDSMVEIHLLEDCVRDDLNRRAFRKMAVLRPLKLVLENYPDDQAEEFDVPNNPEDPNAGTRKVPFSKVLYIEQEDFREVPPKKYFRLSPGKEVRLRAAYLITCTRVVKDPSTGEITEILCHVDHATRGGTAPDGRSPKGTLHWVSAAHALDADVRLYDRLFSGEDPNKYPENADFTANLNPHSLVTLNGCKVEPSLAGSPVLSRFQFERQGYFCVDPDSQNDRLVFNRTVTLRDTWAKIEARQK
jgi:glutaminyl-tRNA synthetase